MTKPAALAVLSLSEQQAGRLVIVDSRRLALREELAEVNKEFITLLPVATEVQLAEVVKATRYETALPEGCRVNVDFRLTEVQNVAVEKARRERVAQCKGAKAQMVESVANDAAEELVSYKVRVGSKQTTTSLRFVRTHTPSKAKTLTLPEMAALALTLPEQISDATAEAAAQA